MGSKDQLPILEIPSRKSFSLIQSLISLWGLLCSEHRSICGGKAKMGTGLKEARVWPWESIQDLVVCQRLAAARDRWKGSRFLSWAKLSFHKDLGKCVWLPAAIWLLQTSLADLWCCTLSTLAIYQEHIPDLEQNLFRVRINFNIIFFPSGDRVGLCNSNSMGHTVHPQTPEWWD